MSKERLDDIVDDLLNNRLELTSFVAESLEQAERVQDQQATIDSLSMAHDNLQRELADIKSMLPLDKHTLIKSNIDKSRMIKKLQEQMQELEKGHLLNIKRMEYKLNKLEKENEKLQKIASCADRDARESKSINMNYLKLLEMVIDNGQCSSIDFIIDKIS